ncbi:MAG TPA: non-homologous end-joining DNA ligase [Kofleriaceae bacterium]|nr:non-homologous end-joining DNA ligase [Kofleriaceae bacterium]
MKLEGLQLARLVDQAPDGDEWLHEQKFDGYRILATLDHGEVELLSRRFKDWTDSFPSVAEAVAQLRAKRAVLDGEVAVVMPDGRTSFQALQNAFGRRDANIVYFVFDLLELDGEDIAKLPLEQRKEKLHRLIGKNQDGVIRYSDHVIGHGGEFFQLACKQGLEGIVSKRRDKPYTPGRGPGWLKTKCWLRQELVIGGYTDPEGLRTHIGALLVGYYEDGTLKYAGKVGTGFTMKMLVELKNALAPLEIAKSPFVPDPPRTWTGSGRHWVTPTLVAEVSFAEWTNDGRLRHPSFQGLRADKLATDIIRERATHVNRQ